MEFEIFDLGLIDYKKAWDFQKETFFKVRNGDLASALILCQHYPVITLGRLADKNNILISEQELKHKGIELFYTERGGDVTYHGPGQLSVYPIFDLHYFNRDIHKFLRYLEDMAINLFSGFGINAVKYPGLTGVWVGRQKIASIGIAIKNWISFHGLSLNIKEDDLHNFCLIRPCGMDIEVTSLESLLGKGIEISSVKNKIIRKFQACLPAGREDIYGQGALAGIKRGD